jgi:hypothetical protein
MSALVMADEVARFNEGERVHTRLYAFLALFLWPLSAVAVWLAAMAALMLVGLDDQSWLRTLLWLVGLAGLVASAVSQLRRLRAADAALDAFYGGDAVVASITAEVLPAPGAGEAAPPALRLLSGCGYVLLAAPRCAAKSKFSFRRAISWDAAQLAAAQTLFEALGATGGAWVACSKHPGSGGLMAGLERLELVEHRIDQGCEIRLHPDIRRRYFPKDPAQAMQSGPPRRS